MAAEPVRPGDVIDLSNWRLTLPVDTKRPGEPDEIRPPQVRSFVEPRYFFTRSEATGSDVTGVVFRAPCGGATTKGSRYPRCELRQVNSDGSRTAWNTTDDATQTLTARIAITATPAVKKHVVCAQIHDADDDLIMIRLEGTKLFIERNEAGDVMLNRRYKLGTPFDLKIEAGHGSVRVWHDGNLAMTWKVARTGCYFKAGCYTQSNVKRGDESMSFGEVVIHRLQVGTE